MEAFSITPATADYRPTKAQAQSSLGDLFQALLRDSARQADADPTPSRPDTDRNRVAPRRDVANNAADEQIDRRRDPNNDVGALAATNEIAARPDPANNAQENRTVTANPADQPERSGQAADRQLALNGAAASAEPSGTPEPSKAGTEDAGAAPGDLPPSNGLGLTQPIAAPAPISVAAPIAPTTSDVVPAFADAKTSAGGTVPVTEPAPDTAVAKPTGDAVRVTVTTAPVVAPPSANLGGGATVAALADTPLAGANVSPATADQGGAAANTQAAPATPDGQVVSRTAGQPAPEVAAVAQAAAGSTPAKPSTQAAAGSNATSTQGDETADLAPAGNNGSGKAASPADTQDTPSPGSALRATTAPSAPAASPTARSDVAQAEVAQTDVAQAKAGRTSDTLPGSTNGPTGQGQESTARTTNAAAPPASAPSQQASVAARAGVEPAAPAVTSTPAPAAAAQNQSAGVGPGPVQSQVAVTSDAEAPGGTDSTVGRIGGAPGTPAGGIGQVAARLPEVLNAPIRSGASHPVTIDQVAVEIQKAASAGKDHIRIRLNPAELGQIDVTLKVGQDGHVKAVVTADKPETYQMLHRDMRGLERALQDAGLKTDSGSLSFNLRGEGQNGQADRQASEPGAAPILRTSNDSTLNTEDLSLPPPTRSDRVLDIRV